MRYLILLHFRRNYNVFIWSVFLLWDFATQIKNSLRFRPRLIKDVKIKDLSGRQDVMDCLIRIFRKIAPIKQDTLFIDQTLRCTKNWPPSICKYWHFIHNLNLIGNASKNFDSQKHFVNNLTKIPDFQGHFICKVSFKNYVSHKLFHVKYCITVFQKFTSHSWKNDKICQWKIKKVPLTTISQMFFLMSSLRKADII